MAHGMVRQRMQKIAPSLQCNIEQNRHSC